MKKLKSIKGETLAEVLVGILIAAVSTSLFLSMVSVSAQINRRAAEADTLFYRTVSLLEGFRAEDGAVEAEPGRQLHIEGGSVSDTLSVSVFYGDGMASYELWQEGGKDQ